MKRIIIFLKLFFLFLVFMFGLNFVLYKLEIISLTGGTIVAIIASLVGGTIGLAVNASIRNSANKRSEGETRITYTHDELCDMLEKDE